METIHRFKAHLRERRLTQAAAAVRLGVDRQTVNGWACGRSTPRGPARIAIMAVLGYRWPKEAR